MTTDGRSLLGHHRIAIKEECGILESINALETRINHQDGRKGTRLLDRGENIGVYPLSESISKAQEYVDYEISPTRCSVAKIMGMVNSITSKRKTP